MLSRQRTEDGRESELIEGMMMKMLLSQFEAIVNLIQMKSMKAIYTLKNMMIQEFQHFMEFQLIEAMKKKKQMIQFESIVNLIQMKLMKVIYNFGNMMIREFQRSGGW
jgi:hypothetical protein